MKIKSLVSGIALASLSTVAFAGGHGDMMDHKHGEKCDKHGHINYDYVELGYQSVDATDSGEVGGTQEYDEAKGFYAEFSKKLNRDTFVAINYESLEDKGTGAVDDSVDFESLTLGGGHIVKLEKNLHVVPSLHLIRTKVGDGNVGQYTLNRYKVGVDTKYVPNVLDNKLELNAGISYSDDMSDKSNPFTGQDLLHESVAYNLGAKYSVTRDMSLNVSYDIVDAEKNTTPAFDLNGDTLKVGINYRY